MATHVILRIITFADSTYRGYIHQLINFMLYIYDNHSNILLKYNILDEASEKDMYQSTEKRIKIRKYFHQ